jgi:hypothetical protein
MWLRATGYRWVVRGEGGEVMDEQAASGIGRQPPGRPAVYSMLEFWGGLLLARRTADCVM